jgi:MFS family permease
MAAAIFFMFLNTGPTNTVLANVTAPNIRATAFAINIFMIHALGDAISPTLIGVLSDRTGSMTNAFLLVGIAMVVAGVVWLIGARYLDQDTAKYA